MSLENSFYSMLSGISGVSALVGTRIYAGRVPQNAATPYCVYYLLNTEAYNKLSEQPSKERKVYVINCIAETYEGAHTLAEAVKAGMTAGYLTGESEEYYDKFEEFGVALNWSFIG